MATLKVPASLAFFFNGARVLRILGYSLKPDLNFINFFIELNKSDRMLMLSELIKRLGNLTDKELIVYYGKFKDIEVRELIRVVLSTREDFKKKMCEGDFDIL